jgi:hypothetical protein
MLTKEKVNAVLASLTTQFDSVKWKDDEWRDNFLTYWCEVTFRIDRGNAVLAFCFDEDGMMIPSMTGGPNLKQLSVYNAAYSRALAVIAALELKQL